MEAKIIVDFGEVLARVANIQFDQLEVRAAPDEARVEIEMHSGDMYQGVARMTKKQAQVLVDRLNDALVEVDL